MKIGQFIYTARKRKGISQEELSSLLDVSRQSISLWETDQTIPTLDKLQAMCKILDVSMDELTGVEPIKEKKIGIIKPSIEEWNARLEQQNKKFELVAFLISLITIFLWISGGIGIFVSLISIVLNVICLFLKRNKYCQYGLIISITFFIASIFAVSYF
jgi:transcriptional regulator with XRE-family HTH domain